MRLFKKLFSNASEIEHLKKLISVQKQIVEVHESTLFLLKDINPYRSIRLLIEDYLREAKKELEAYQEDLRKLES